MPPRAAFISRHKPDLPLPRERVTFRTLHPLDMRERRVRELSGTPEPVRALSLDRLVTISLIRVDALNPTPGERLIDWHSLHGEARG